MCVSLFCIIYVCVYFVLYYKIVKPESFHYQPQSLLSALIKREMLIPFNVTSYLLEFDAPWLVTESLRRLEPARENCLPIPFLNENGLIFAAGHKIELASVTTTFLIESVACLDVHLL